jgi:V/A-type H+-transporting ATPase subunit C
LSKAKRYSNVTVKIGSERGNLLSEQELKRLAESKSLTEFVAELKNSSYAEGLTKIPAPYDACRLERFFRQSLIETYAKIVKSAPTSAVGFLKTLVARYEYENLKNLLRAVNIGLPQQEVMNRIYIDAEDFLRNKRLFESATDAINVKSIVETLKTTVYGPLLMMGLTKYDETRSTKYFDFLLDKKYYENLVRSFKNLPKKEQARAKFYVSMETDGFTLFTILRGKILNYDPHSIGSLIPAFHFELSEKTVDEALKSDNFESALNVIKQSHYGKFFTKAESPEKTLTLAEKAFKQSILEHARKNMINDTFTIGAPIGFMVQKEAETYNLVALSLGLEYLWKPDEIISSLLLAD